MVGLTWFDLLADGAAIAPEPTSAKARSNSSATGWSGTRSPTVAPPAVTSLEIDSAAGSTIVSGPGQNAAARSSATEGHAAACRFAKKTSGTCTISGLVDGRPLTSKIRATARSEVASAPRP